jgi:excisionase family DNA binding protein
MMNQSNSESRKGKCTDLGHLPVQAYNTRTADDRRLIDDQKLSIPEAAKALGISPNSLRRIIEQGRLPVLRILKKTLILASDVEQFLQESRMSVRRVENNRPSLPPLPAAVINSRHLRGVTL